jgi:hypothetical protein
MKKGKVYLITKCLSLKIVVFKFEDKPFKNIQMGPEGHGSLT